MRANQGPRCPLLLMTCVIFRWVTDAYFTLWSLSLQSAVDIDGHEVNLSKYAGKKAVIVVNVASACGYTDANYKGRRVCCVSSVLMLINMLSTAHTGTCCDTSSAHIYVLHSQSHTCTNAILFLYRSPEDIWKIQGIRAWDPGFPLQSVWVKSHYILASQNISIFEMNILMPVFL